MQFSLDHSDATYIINSCEPTKVIVNDTPYADSLLLLPDQIIHPWAVTDIQQLCIDDLAPTFDIPELLLIIGSGQTFQFPEIDVLTSLQAKNVAYEVMDNAAACRTYNLLNSDGRAVAMSLILG